MQMSCDVVRQVAGGSMQYNVRHATNSLTRASLARGSRPGGCVCSFAGLVNHLGRAQQACTISKRTRLYNSRSRRHRARASKLRRRGLGEGQERS